MTRIIFVILITILALGCDTEKKPENTVEDTAVEALPENLGDPTAPTQIKALKGAKEVKKRLDQQRKDDSNVLQESN